MPGDVGPDGPRYRINPAAGQGHPSQGDQGPMAPAPPAPRRGGRHRRPRRRWPRRLLVGANIVLVLVLVGAGAAYGYVHYRLGQIPRISVQATAPKVAPSQPETFLLVGSDTRKGQSASQFGSTTQVQGQRSDVIILVHVVPATHKAAMLSIPRDTRVKIAGTGQVDRINSAFNTGTPDRLIQTIHADFGIAVNHFVEVNFSGLEGLVNTVGGVCMHFPYPVRDGSPTGTGNESGLKEPAGNQLLNGSQALSLVRSRFYQYYKNGSWHAEGTGDLGRIKRQHEFLRVLAEKAIKSGIHNPIKANSLVSQAVNDVTVGNGLTTPDILHMIGSFRSLRPSTVPSWTLPTTADTSSSGAYLGQIITQPQANQAIAAWKAYGSKPASTSTTSGPPSSSTAPPTTQASVAPSQVSVQVLNGSGVSGQAGQAAQGLTSAGFQVTTYGDAPSYGHAASVVTYGPGAKAAAATVAAHVKGGATINEDPSISGSTVILTTGSSFAGVSPTALAGSGQTSATASPPTSAATTSTSTAPAAASAAAPSTNKLPPWDPTPC
ncbi:MAG: LCP family protein [Acidimicrobiales bacterium]